MDAQLGLGDYDDETLVRAALQAAYPEDRPVFSQRRGEQIVRAAAVEELERGDRHSLVGGRIAACLAAAFTLFAGTAGAASAALPGQPLYPLKRVVERAMVAVTTDDGDAARVELELAERRLEEAEAVIVQGDPDPQTTDSLERQFNEHLNAASSLGGDDVDDEVDGLRTREQASEAPDQSAAAVTPAGPAGDGGALLVPEVTPAPSVSPSPSGDPSPSTLPSPLPSEAASPAPNASPSPSSDAAPPRPADASGPGAPSASPSPLPNGVEQRLDAITDVGEDVRTTAD